eukprot:COSAG01_NODE_973_length_12368_cov_12.435732_13_plen_142_part_00
MIMSACIGGINTILVQHGHDVRLLGVQVGVEVVAVCVVLAAHVIPAPHITNDSQSCINRCPRAASQSVSRGSYHSAAAARPVAGGGRQAGTPSRTLNALRTMAARGHSGGGGRRWRWSLTAARPAAPGWPEAASAPPPPGG